MLSENFNSIDQLNEFTSQSLRDLGEHPRGEGGFAGEGEVAPPEIPEVNDADEFELPANKVESRPESAKAAQAQVEPAGTTDRASDAAKPDDDSVVAGKAAEIESADQPEQPTEPDDQDDYFDVAERQAALEASVQSPVSSEQPVSDVADQALAGEQSAQLPEPQPTDQPQTEQAQPQDFFDLDQFRSLSDTSADDQSTLDNASAPSDSGTQQAHLGVRPPRVSSRQSGPLPAGNFPASPFGNSSPSFGSDPESQDSGDGEDSFEGGMTRSDMMDMAREVLSPMFQETNVAFVGHIADEMTIQNELTRAGRLFG